ncbi:MAG TPA: carboxypeptidase-like regulatory domain-containing protein [Thermoanaerobaculia bacterium]|nr:carboxypeptidase-like regulatory domain-containing protein [Thermoanaerobaculia bacterium]
MRLLPVPLILLLLVACKGSPTEPHGMAQINMLCLPAGTNVQCTASTYNFDGVASQDVTNKATWLVTNPIGTFTASGLFVPSGSGEVSIWVRYKTLEYNLKSSFLVGPGQPARWLYYVSGTVTDAATGERLEGVTVQMLDGYAVGKSSVTGANGVYRIEPVLTGETFTIVASKPGYASMTKTYRVDPPVGPAGSNSPFLNFALGR